jgi:hypothetical protein
MNTRMFWTAVAVIFMISWTSQAQMKKYNIKSGVVTYDQNLKVMGMEMKKKIVVYFDDFGVKECRETYSGDKLEERYFSDGNNLYSVKPSKKQAFKRGVSSRGTELRMEWSDFATEKDRQSGKFKKLPDMTIAGKKCEVFEHDDGNGAFSRYGGWNKILMYLHVKSKSVESVKQAVKVEENAKVSPEKFNIPAGFAVQ